MSFDEDWGLPTEHVEAVRARPANAHLELRVVRGGEREFRFPFLTDELDLASEAAAAFPREAPWTARLVDDSRVILIHRPSGKEYPLTTGDSLELEERRIWLVDVRQPPVASLEGVTETVAGRVWHLHNHASWIGRAGKRLNHVDIDHPTISRTHGTFVPNPAGGMNLLCESQPGATTVNGQALERGQLHPLKNGDLLALGKLMFRYVARSEEAGDQAAGLVVNTLGQFRLSLRGEAGTETVIRNEKARWLFARLAVKWGAPYSVELLLAEFWPEGTAEQGRRNLSYTLSQLKGDLAQEGFELDQILDRNRREIRLLGSALNRHDFVEVEAMTAGRKPLTSEASLERLCSLYSGPFLPECYETWAAELRSGLQSDVHQTLLATAAEDLKTPSRQLYQRALEAVFSIDPQDEKAAELFMEGSLADAKPDQAVRCFELVKKALNEDGLEPGTALLKLYHRARLGI